MENTFKQCRNFNVSIAELKNQIENKSRDVQKRQEEIQQRINELGPGQLARECETIKEGLEATKKRLLVDEAKVYAETYERIEAIVTRICRSRGIGIVVRKQIRQTDPNDRDKILQYVNRQVVYSAVLDITGDVVAELNR
jgi:TolA-binding protein